VDNQVILADIEEDLYREMNKTAEQYSVQFATAKTNVLAFERKVTRIFKVIVNDKTLEEI
jgi:hypothetical protein